MTIPGFTSTGSKRPEALFGAFPGAPMATMVRADGCRVWDADGNEYLDTVMALGAVALGYAYPSVVAAAARAVRDGAVGPVPPACEAQVAERLAAAVPLCESVRFLKTGAEAVAAAVRIARVHTGRERAITCGYHGWLDWCADAAGVPDAVRALRRRVEPGDLPALQRALDEFAPVAAVVIEPAVDGPPDRAWLEGARRLASAAGAILVFDEIKTGFRVARGGAAERTGVRPDLIVLGKALGNGFPIAAVGGPRDLMEAAAHTWISSTLATEFVALAAAGAVLDAYRDSLVIERLAAAGGALFGMLERLAGRYGEVVTGVRGMPQLCYPTFRTDEVAGRVARAAFARGLLFKRNAYNYVSLAHTADVLRLVEERLEEAVDEVIRTC